MIIANKHFRQLAAIPILHHGNVKVFPSKQGQSAISNRLELVLASISVRYEMKTLLLAATTLAVVATVSLSPVLANRLGPFDTRVTDWSDMSGQNGINAATTTADGRHYEWQYHYGRHGWEGNWVPSNK